MEQAAAERKTSTGPIFHDLAERFKKRGIVIVFSDLFDDVDTMMAGLKHFRHRRHEVILMHVLDPAELEFPFQQTTLFRGLEQLPEVLVEPPRAAKGILGRVRNISAAAETRLPCAADRLRADAHRSIARGGAVELFGVERVGEGRGGGAWCTCSPYCLPRDQRSRLFEHVNVVP